MGACLVLGLAACRTAAAPPDPARLPPPPPPSGDAAAGPCFEFPALDALLHRFVSGDRVDYAALQRDRGSLDAVLEDFAALAPETLAACSRAGQMAFWINAYNAWTLRAIVDAYPVRGSWLRSLAFPRSSIRQIPDVWDWPHPVAGRELSLNDIEHAILRRQFRDPRVHFAANCASVGCPPLRAEAYTGARLEEQLEDQARRFWNDPVRNHVDPQEDVVELSSLFRWYGEDFGGPRAFLEDRPDPAAVLRAGARWIDPARREFLETFPPERIDYLDYDWTLNDVPRRETSFRPGDGKGKPLRDSEKPARSAAVRGGERTKQPGERKGRVGVAPCHYLRDAQLGCPRVPSSRYRGDPSAASGGSGSCSSGSVSSR